MYIVEMVGGERVLKVDGRNELSVFAGTGEKGDSGDGGPATQAQFNGMHSLMIGPADDVFIADTFNSRIRRVGAKSGIVQAFAGTGKRGFSGDGGPAIKAEFGNVYCLAFDAARENLFVADLDNRRIRAVSLRTGIVTTVAGNGERGVPKDGTRAKEAPLLDPRAVAVDSQGAIYILERNGNALRKVEKDGTIRTVAGSGKKGNADGEGMQAEFNSPKHICVDREDNVIIADSDNHLIRKYSRRDGRVTRIAGGGTGDQALNQPHGVRVDNAGTLYVADSSNGRVMKLGGEGGPASTVRSPEVRPDGKVTFRLFAPKASEAGVFADWMQVGTLEKMTKGADGIWSVTLGPVPPGIYIYHFKVDEMTIADPVNPKIKLRARTSASLLEIPGNSPEIWEYRDVPHGTVEIVHHRANTLGGETRQAWVYKPPGYDGKSKRYPVLFLLHGSNDTPAGWSMVGRANYIMDNLLAEQKAREMIIVMPFGHAVPFDAPREEQRNNAAKFEAYLLQDLQPLIESRYRIARNRDHRAIIGLSMGGGQALQIGLGHLDLFSAVGAFSGAVPRDFRTRFAGLLDAPQETNKKLKLLWIGCGKEDSMFKASQELSEILDSHNIRHVFRPSEGAHTYTVWRQYFAEVAPLLFRKQ
jgi:enterochelin esterase-like enzyme/DNA-binding beta-propeller fold protein YncE